jgi:hypothetical protein
LAVLKVHNNEDVNSTQLAYEEKAMKYRYFRVVMINTFVLGTFFSSCGYFPSTPIATPTQPATNTPEPTVTSTSTPTITPSPTATPDFAATQQYEDFVSIVKMYYEAGQIPTIEGEYVVLDDYQDELASKLAYAWTETGVNAKNFIVRADFEWSNAINTVNFSGCGFIYRMQSNQDHYVIILDALNGVKLASHTDRGTISMGSPQNGDQTVSDFGSNPYQATFTLIVNELKTYVYINDIYYGEYKLLEHRIIDLGALASAVLSAASEGYGTRCKMTNVRAWIIDP